MIHTFRREKHKRGIGGCLNFFRQRMARGSTNQAEAVSNVCVSPFNFTQP